MLVVVGGGWCHRGSVVDRGGGLVARVVIIVCWLMVGGVLTPFHGSYGVRQCELTSDKN